MEVISTIGVKKFIDSLTNIPQARVRRMVRSLEENGHTLRLPDSKSLRKGLFELRILGSPQIRILYFFHQDRAFLVHAFYKKTMRIPQKEIEYGRKVMQDRLGFL